MMMMIRQITKKEEDTHFLTERRTTQSPLKSLGHCQVASVCEWRLHQLLLYPKVLKSIVEFGICHVDAQLLQDISILRIKVETHLRQPVERLGVVDTVLD